MLDKNISLAEKIWALFREQRITIASILTATEMAIRMKSLKEWVRNKLKALSSLLGKLGIKAAEALPAIIEAILSWILNKATDVVGWVSQNLWALVAGIGELLYTNMVTKK